MNKCGCYDYSKVLTNIKEVLKIGKDAEIAVLCDPETTDPVIVRYSFKEFGTDTLPIPVAAYNIDGTTYSGNISTLIPCASGGGGSGAALLEYFICDDGNQKIVRVCGTACGTLTTTYYDLDGTESTEPVDWDLVVAGTCPINFSNATANIERRTETGAGTIVGALSLTISNVGDANGEVEGEPIYPNQTITMTAFTNEFTKVVYFLPNISYDGTGTTLSITIMS